MPVSPFNNNCRFGSGATNILLTGYNVQQAAACRKRKQNEVERLHVRIGALELANAALSGRLSLRETEMTRLNSISAAKFAGDSLLSGLLCKPSSYQACLLPVRRPTITS